MNIKKEGEYYSQMVRLYREEYGGKNGLLRNRLFKNLNELLR